MDLGSLSPNNKSVPTLNFSVSGSTANPIIQGTFQSGETSIISGYSINGQSWPMSSALTYLSLNLGPLTDNANIATVNGYSGIYVKATILKPGDATLTAYNLKNGVVFEHFGSIYLPYLYSSKAPDDFPQNLMTEFNVKSRTWNVDNYQATNYISFLPNNGLDTNYDPVYEGLEYSSNTTFFTPYPMWLDVNSNDDLILNCQIRFVHPTATSSYVQGFMVKGTYLLV